jgi:hypothetical protein
MLEEKAASCWDCGLFRVYMLAKSRKIGFGSLRGGWGCAAVFAPLFGGVACGICLLLYGTGPPAGPAPALDNPIRETAFMCMGVTELWRN